MMDEDKVTLAKVETQLENLTKMVQEMRDTLGTAVVTRKEWELRNIYVDSKISALEKDNQELKEGRGPWWVWVMAAVAGISLIWNFAQPIVQAVIAR